MTNSHTNVSRSAMTSSSTAPRAIPLCRHTITIIDLMSSAITVEWLRCRALGCLRARLDGRSSGNVITSHAERNDDAALAPPLAPLAGRPLARLGGADASLSNADAHQGARQGSGGERCPAQQRLPDHRRAETRGPDQGAQDGAGRASAGADHLRGDRRGAANAKAMD